MKEQEWLDKVEQLSSAWKDRCDLVIPTTAKYQLSRMIFEAVWRFNEWDLKILREILEDNRDWMVFEAHQRLKIEGILSGFWIEECATDGICQTSCPLISCGVSDFRGAVFVFGVEPDWSSRLPVSGFA